jgi:hypothetical protein
MDSTTAQSSSLPTVNLPAATFPILPANSSLMQPASGFSMALLDFLRLHLFLLLDAAFL